MTKFATLAELESAQDQAYAMHNDGASMKSIQEELGLNYSQAWLGISARQLASGEADTTKLDPNDPKAIYQARMEEGEYSSWGWLAVRAGVPESRVRKIFREASTFSDRGLRIGKGGRFVADKADEYVDEARVHGVKLPIGQGTIAKAKAEAPDYSKATIKEINAALKAKGLPITGKKADKLARLA